MKAMRNPRRERGINKNYATNERRGDTSEKEVTGRAKINHTRYLAREVGRSPPKRRSLGAKHRKRTSSDRARAESAVRNATACIRMSETGKLRTDHDAEPGILVAKGNDGVRAARRSSETTTKCNAKVR